MDKGDYSAVWFETEFLVWNHVIKLQKFQGKNFGENKSFFFFPNVEV